MVSNCFLHFVKHFNAIHFNSQMKSFEDKYTIWCVIFCLTTRGHTYTSLQEFGKGLVVFSPKKLPVSHSPHFQLYQIYLVDRESSKNSFILSTHWHEVIVAKGFMISEYYWLLECNCKNTRWLIFNISLWGKQHLDWAGKICCFETMMCLKPYTAVSLMCISAWDSACFL